MRIQGTPLSAKYNDLATKLNVHKQPMIFNIGDLVWLDLCKDRFPNERKSKILPRADWPFKVLARYNNNAYKIDIPHDKYNVRYLQPQGSLSLPW